MSPPRSLSPADEYELQQAERCARASRQVDRWYLLTVVPYVGSFVVGVWPGVPLWAFPVAFGVFFLFAVATGVVTLRNWSHLRWGKRLYGLAPWAFCLLVTLPFVVSALR